MSKALSISELAELLIGTWKTEDESGFQPIDALPVAKAEEQSGFIETPMVAQGGGNAVPAPRHFSPNPDIARTLDSIPQLGEDDPIRQAWRAGFDSGTATEKRLAAEMRGEDLAAIGQLRDLIRQVDSESVQMIEDRLREVVIALCRQVIDDFPVPIDRLATRIHIAVRMLAQPHNEKVIEVNSTDQPLLVDQLPPEWKLVATPNLPRGAMRVVTADGGIEDGPEQWKLALEEAIRTC